MPLQLSVVHALLSLQTTVVPPPHTPLAQASLLVHTLPSSHGPLLAASTQPASASQLSAVHTLPSSQLSVPAPPLQVPAPQASPTLQALPSLHPAVLLTYTQPLAESQPSLVHGLPSTQVGPGPGTQLPLAQASLTVQLLPSSQAPVVAVLTQPVVVLHESLVQPLVSLQLSNVPGLQTPVLHTSFWLQALLSEHGATLLTNAQPLAGLQVSLVHGLPSLQVTAAPPAHAPVLQASPPVQALASSQVAPLLAKAQPVAALQLSLVHGLLSLHAWAGPGLHAPLAQASLLVHTLPSLQAALLLTLAQPLAGLQLSLVQALPSLHTTLAPAAHLPSAHLSPLVQALPSSQARVLLAVVQPLAGLQLSLVHRLPSSQVCAAPGTQTPALHASFWVHTLPSLHAAALAVATQPLAGLQLSVVHGLPSLQVTAVPDAQVPALHPSPLVQALLSSQAALLAAEAQPVVALQLSLVQAFLSSQLSAAPDLH